MKEEILNQFMTKALNYLNSAEAFASKEIPLFIQEVIKLETMSNWLGLAMSGVFLLLMIILLLYFLTRCIRNDNDFEGFIAGCFSVGMLVSGVIFFGEASDLIKINYAPRVFLLEYVKKM